MSEDRRRRIATVHKSDFQAMIASGAIGVPAHMFTNSRFIEIELASDDDEAKVDSPFYLGLFSN